MIGDSDVGHADHTTLVHPVGLSWAKSTFGVLRWSPQNSQTLCSTWFPEVTRLREGVYVGQGIPCLQTLHKNIGWKY